MNATLRMPRSQRRAQLLQLATAEFTDKGYQGTSMDDIALAAGVTKPVLYQHFASKEALFSEVIDITSESLLTEVRDLLTVGDTAAARVRHGLRRFYDLVSLDGALQLFTGRDRVSPALQERVGGVLEEMAGELAGVVAAARRLTPSEARVIGHSLLVTTQSTAALLHGAADEAEREEILEVATTLIVGGLTAFEPRQGPPASPSADATGHA